MAVLDVKIKNARQNSLKQIANDAVANSSVQLEAERWVVGEFLPHHFDGLLFGARKLKLVWGGYFDCDAVSDDGRIVGLVSTSAARTVSGKQAIGKYQKLKADALYLLNIIGAERLFMIFTELSMLQHFENEIKLGRFPPKIVLLHAELPAELKARLLKARQVASAETAPTSSRNLVGIVRRIK